MLTVHSLRREAVEREVADRFTTAPGGAAGPGRVGVELEWMPAVAGPGGPVPLGVPDSRRLLAADRTLVSDARLTFEPGGQLEISPPPSPSVTALLDALTKLQARVLRCLEPAGAELLVGGLNPWHESDALGLQTPQPRYVSMQRHFDGIGPFGRRMMRQSMALQVSLDLGDARVAAQRWRLANLVGPALGAAFANSPIVAGQVLGIPGGRSQAWQRLDPTRTGFDGAQVGHPEPEAYRDFALAASYIELAPAGARLSEKEDVAYHLSTLFPPVRPRHHLEVRYLDALPTRWMAVPVIVLTALLYDEEARSRALERVGTGAIDAAAWCRSCELGVSDPAIRDVATGLFGVAMRAIPRFPAGYFPTGAANLLAEYAERFPASGRCPADDQLESYRQDPEDLAPWK